MRFGTRRGLTALLVAMLVATACGSTANVAGDGGTPTLGASGDETGVATDEFGMPIEQSDAVAPSGAPAEDGDGVPPSLGDRGSAGTQSAPSTPSTPSTPSEPSASGPTGPGITATEIKLGFVYVANWDAGRSAVFGESGGYPSSAQFKAMWQGVIDDLNAKGGILGRKIVPVWFEYDIFSTRSTEVQDQAACATWTQDNKVFAAFLAVNYTEVLLGCLEKAGVLTFAPFDGKSMEDRVIQDRYPHFVSAALNLSRMPEVYIGVLDDQGFFTKDAKIGLVVTDTPQYIRASDNDFKPALARRSLKLTEEVRVARVHGVNEFSDGASSMQNAVLRLRSAGVTHVLFLAGPGTTILWYQQAPAQGYRPKVGLSTNDWFISSDNPADMAGAQGVGWRPGMDFPNGPKNEKTARCDAITRAKLGNPNAWAYQDCDALWTFAAAAQAGGQPDRDAVLAGLERLGRTHHAGLFQTRYAHDRKDGVSAVAPAQWFADCDCWRYTAAPKELP